MGTRTEDELDVLVSIAIQRAELLEDARLPGAADAWREVMECEKQLSAITDAAGIPGGIARVGAVRAALAAGDVEAARRLGEAYLAEPHFPEERKTAIHGAIEDRESRRARRYRALAKHGTLEAVDRWKASRERQDSIFPLRAA